MVQLQSKKEYFEQLTAAARDAQKNKFVNEANAWRKSHGANRQVKVSSIEKEEEQLNSFIKKSY